MTEKVCQEYLQQFPTGVAPVKNEDRINFMLSHPIIRDKLDEWVTLQKPADEEDEEDVTGRNQLIPHKSEEHSVKKREEGNSYFKRKSFVDSIRCYNEALQFTSLTTTKDENKNAALCFGNRSAAYYELGTPKGGLLVKKALENSLSDTLHCVKYGYPENLKIKILLRQVNIYLKLGNIEKAHESFQAACSCSDISKEAQIKINHLQTELDKLPSQKTQQQDDDDVQNSNTKLEEFRENPLFQGASEALSIHCSKEKTRYVKCNKNVTFGEILFKETPFSSVLLPSYYGTHCFHCHCHLDNNLYFFPCSSCSQVKFCSEECFSSSWEIYHKYECGYLDLLHSVGIGHLATRIILTAGKREILDSIDMDRSAAEKLQLSTKVFKTGQHLYHRVLSLLDHIDVMRVEDLFQYTLTASLLTNFLVKKTCFFDDTREEDISKIGGALLKHICQLICNAHAITFIASDHEVLTMSTTDESQLRIASAIYTSSSLMNHSCEPNIASSFYQGRTLLVKATSDLRKGSEVFNCYGPHARRMNRTSRQEILSQQYFFTCDCPACERELEEEFSFVDKFNALKCKKCSGPIVPDTQKQSFLVECPECAIFTNVEESMHGAIRICRLIKKAEQKLDQALAADALSTLLEAHDMCKKYLYRFNCDTGKVNDLLAKCYSILGNFDAAVRYLEQSVEYVEERFGESSVEYARELKKLGELMKLRSNSTEEEKKLAQGNIDKANDILKLYF